jgi:predicted protein tyrosine phosphatase
MGASRGLMRPWIANRSQLWVNSNPAPDRCALISITQPGGRTHIPEGYVDVLRLEFEDFGSPVAGSFNEAQAVTVAEFALKHRGENILIHCGAGRSRSGAVVEVLLRAFPEYQDAGEGRAPNPHVSSLLERALAAVMDTPYGELA